jgi:hypothetical protein
MSHFSKIHLVVLFVGALTTVSIQTAAQETPANDDSFESGHHIGVTLRIACAGDWKIQWEGTSSYWNPSQDAPVEEKVDRYEYGSLGATPGFGLFWEYLTSGRIFAPGIWLGMQFHSQDYYEMRHNLGAEIQLDPRLRIFFARKGWWRPYFQGAAGFSIGIPNRELSDDSDNHVKYALAINMNGSIGSLFAPKHQNFAFFIEAGIEGVFFWVEELNPDGSTNEEYSGYTRQLLIALGFEY